MFGFVIFIIIALIAVVGFFLVKQIGEQKQYKEEDRAYEEEENRKKEIIKQQQSPQFYREQIKKYANDENKLEEIEKIVQDNVRKAIKSGNKEEEKEFRQILKSIKK